MSENQPTEPTHPSRDDQPALPGVSGGSASTLGGGSGDGGASAGSGSGPAFGSAVPDGPGGAVTGSEQGRGEGQTEGQGQLLGADTPGEASTTVKDPSEWVTGDEPMTGAQRSYLDTLARAAGEQLPADLNKAQASEHIDRLQAKTGRGNS
jgi:hypothetical protein